MSAYEVGLRCTASWSEDLGGHPPWLAEGDMDEGCRLDVGHSGWHQTDEMPEARRWISEATARWAWEVAEAEHCVRWRASSGYMSVHRMALRWTPLDWKHPHRSTPVVRHMIHGHGATKSTIRKERRR